MVYLKHPLKQENAMEHMNGNGSMASEAKGDVFRPLIALGAR